MSSLKTLIRDIATLSKPGLTAMNVMMTAGAMGLAPTPIPLVVWVMILIASTLLIASANTLNMYYEREGDKLMTRTRQRPLPAGRMDARRVFIGGVLAGLASLGILWHWGNLTTMLIGASAWVSYVWIYTPMKRQSRWSVVVGAYPGAIPPLLGWVAATGGIGAEGVVLFLIVFFWQVPHFIAISLYRQQDYDRAGIKVWPSERGDEAAKILALLFTLPLVPVSLLLVPLGIASYAYFVLAGGLGVWFFITCLRGFEPSSGARWARHFFIVSIIYLPVLTIGLLIDFVFLKAGFAG